MAPAFAIVFDVSVAADDGLDRHWDHLPRGRMHQHRCDDLVIILFLAVDEANHAVIALDMVRTEVARSVDGDQIVLTIEEPLFKFPPALQFPKQIHKRFVERLDIDAIEDVSHLGIAWHTIDFEGLLDVQLSLMVLKGEHRRFLGGKHGKGTHKRVAHRVPARCLSSAIGDKLEPTPQDFDQRVGGEAASWFG